MLLFETFTMTMAREMSAGFTATYQIETTRKLINRLKVIISIKVLCKLLGKVKV
jgi:hypothetical protein